MRAMAHKLWSSSLLRKCTLWVPLKRVPQRWIFIMKSLLKIFKRCYYKNSCSSEDSRSNLSHEARSSKREYSRRNLYLQTLPRISTSANKEIVKISESKSGNLVSIPYAEDRVESYTPPRDSSSWQREYHSDPTYLVNHNRLSIIYAAYNIAI